jgi:hypothetical protein
LLSARRRCGAAHLCAQGVAGRRSTCCTWGGSCGASGYHAHASQRCTVLWWPNLFRDVAHFVRSCRTCATSKSSSGLRLGVDSFSGALVGHPGITRTPVNVAQFFGGQTFSATSLTSYVVAVRVRHLKVPLVYGWVLTPFQASQYNHLPIGAWTSSGRCPSRAVATI